MIVRYAFLVPDHIPWISESKLRGDFDFDLYLSAALDKTFKKVYDTSIVTYVCIFLAIILWTMVLNSLATIYKVSFCRF